MTRLTRRYRFAASHRLDSPRFSADENRALYGKCNNPYGHGHDYVLEVSVAGPVDAGSGQLVNLGALDRLVSEQVLRDFDHANLSASVADFNELVPTSENILRAIERRLESHWRETFPAGRAHLANIRLQETRRNSFQLQENSK